MAGAAVEVPEAPGKWYYPLLGLLFASLVLAAAIWSAVDQIEDDKAEGDHAGEVDDHGEDDTHE